MKIVCPAPTRFQPAAGVSRAEFACKTPPFIVPQRRTGRRAQGVKYEANVHEHFGRLHPVFYLPGPWIRFNDVSGCRWCQPDGLLVNFFTGRVTIIEVKYQHTSDAWWQLRMLYEPVVRKLFSEELWDFSLCEVVKWYDPSTKFPERVELVPDIGMAKSFGVHIFKP